LEVKLLKAMKYIYYYSIFYFLRMWIVLAGNSKSRKGVEVVSNGCSCVGEDVAGEGESKEA